MLEPRRLHMLAELERLGTVAAVAETLHLTAPGVSMHLRALEREVGLDLTERAGRRLRLTPAGRVLAAHGRRLAEQLDLARHEVAALQHGSTGHYRVTAFPTAARALVARAWASLVRDGGPTIDLTTAEPEAALEALAAGTTDIAVVHSYSNVPRHLSDGLHSTALGTEDLLLVVLADDPGGRSGDLADHRDRPWVTPSRIRTCFETVERACAAAGFAPTVVAETDDYDVQLSLVAAGVGIALLPRMALDRVPRGVEVIAPATTVERHTWAVTRAGAADAGAQRIIDALRFDGLADRPVRGGAASPGPSPG